jgi:hypothetical protein
MNENDMQQQSLLMNALAMQDKQRAWAETNALRSAMQQGLDIRTPEGQAKAVQIAPTAAGPVIKTLMDAQHTAAQAALTIPQGQLAAAHAKKFDQDRLLADTKRYADKAAVDGSPQTLFDGLMTLKRDHGISIAADVAQLEKLQEQFANDPAGLTNAVKKLSLAISGHIDKTLPKVGSHDFGGFVAPTSQDQLSGELTVGAPIAKTQTPESIASNARIASEGAANRAVTMRGQNLVDARTRELQALRAEEVAQGKLSKEDDKKQGQRDKAVTQFASTLQKEGVPEFEGALSTLEDTLSKYPVGKAPGLGRVAGLVPDWMQGAEGENIRQALAAVKNTLLKARSGSAVTENELRRFVEELGSGGFRSETTLRNGVSRIRQRFEKVKANTVAGVADDVKQEYEARGGIPITRGGAVTPVNQEMPKGMDPEDWKHLTPDEKKLWKK